MLVMQIAGSLLNLIQERRTTSRINKQILTVFARNHARSMYQIKSSCGESLAISIELSFVTASICGSRQVAMRIENIVVDTRIAVVTVNAQSNRSLLVLETSNSTVATYLISTQKNSIVN